MTLETMRARLHRIKAIRAATAPQRAICQGLEVAADRQKSRRDRAASETVEALGLLLSAVWPDDFPLVDAPTLTEAMDEALELVDREREIDRVLDARVAACDAAFERLHELEDTF